MRPEDISVKLRLRSSWEAADLGIEMVRTWARDVYPAWLVVTVPAALVLIGFFGPWGLFAFWWLLPLWERITLWNLSRIVFGVRPALGDTLRQLPAMASNAVGDLLWRRFQICRSYFQPVTQLERLGGKQRAQRVRILETRGRNTAAWLTVVFATLRLTLSLAVAALLVFLLPTWASPDWADLWQRFTAGALPDSAYLGLWLLPALIMIAIEPFYVGAGFALYLNRRTQLEGWDLEIVFRAIAQRLTERQTGASGTGAKHRARAAKSVASHAACWLLVTFLALFVAPTRPLSAQPEPETEYVERTIFDRVAPWSGDPLDDPRTVADRVLAHPDFGAEQADVGWRWRGNLFGDNSGLDFDLNFGLLGSLGGLSLVVTLSVFLVLVIAIVTVLLRSRFGIGALAESDARVPISLLGLQVTRESLPENISRAAEALWRQGRQREALSLLYRGALAALLERGVELHESYTEDDCLQAASSVMDSRCLAFVGDLTRAWQSAAYAHRLPSEATAELLWTEWSEHFAVEKPS